MTIARPETVPFGPADKGELTPRQESAAGLLASGLTQATVARKTKIGGTTLKRWGREPAFRSRVSALRAEMTSQAVGRLTDSMASAADTLGFLARRAKQEAVRLAAARAVLELGVKLRETVELEARIADLENARQQPPTRRTA